MSERNCPECNARMEFRLAEFECPSCGHKELKEKPEPERKSSGPGFKAIQPPPAPTATQRTSYQDLHSFSLYGVNDPYRRTGDPAPLHREKCVYFGVILAGDLLFLAIFLLAGINLFSFGYFITLVAMVVGVATGLIILYWVLFGEAVWAKVTCMGINILSVIGIVLSLVFRPYYQPGMSVIDQGIIAGFYVVQGLWVAWFLSILYRDVAKRN